MFASIAAALFQCGCICLLGSDTTITKFPIGAESCGMVRAPFDWQDPAPTPDDPPYYPPCPAGSYCPHIIGGPGQYVYRVSGSGDLLVPSTGIVFLGPGGATTPAPTRLITSANHLKIRIGHGVDLSFASQQEWEAGTQPKVSPETNSVMDNVDGVPPDSMSLVYAGTQYTKSGKHWNNSSVTTNLSESKAWLAVFSFDGRWGTSSGNPRHPFERDESLFGTAYVNLYETGSGREFARAVIELCGCAPSELFSHSHWIADRYFVMEFPASKGGFPMQVCAVPSRGPSNSR
jgi:hypothetical protein